MAIYGTNPSPGSGKASFLNLVMLKTTTGGLGACPPLKILNFTPPEWPFRAFSRVKYLKIGNGNVVFLIKN